MVITFAVFDQNNVHGVFVGAASYVTDPTQPLGDRANPFPTITAALKAASVGDRLEILPGVYTESVSLLPFMSLASADTTSTDSNFVPGQRPGHDHPGPGRRPPPPPTSRSRRRNLQSFVNSDDRLALRARRSAD